MLLYRSSVARAVGAPRLDGAAEAVLQRCGVRGGQPFVLGADGSYDLNLNRFLAELDKWVQWALHERLLAEQPFRMVERTVLGPRGLVRVIVNAEREVDDDCGPVRFLPYVDYLLWRDVGLRGQLPDGGPDPRWRGRHGWRNAVFADLLVSTGMRLGEASSLLLPEVPAVTQPPRCAR